MKDKELLQFFTDSYRPRGSVYIKKDTQKGKLTKDQYLRLSCDHRDQMYEAVVRHGKYRAINVILSQPRDIAIESIKSIVPKYIEAICDPDNTVVHEKDKPKGKYYSVEFPSDFGLVKRNNRVYATNAYSKFNYRKLLTEKEITSLEPNMMPIAKLEKVID